jgi:hypothetical protein
MKILLGDFNAKVRKEDIFKPTIGNESLHEISNDNGVGLVNFVISKNLAVKSIVGDFCCTINATYIFCALLLHVFSQHVSAITSHLQVWL